MGNVTFFDIKNIKRNCKVFFETGTYMGQGTMALMKQFDRGYTTEINPKLAMAMKNRNEKGLIVIQDHSTNALKEYLPQIEEPCLFWLDAHYPGDYGLMGLMPDMVLPLVDELKLIFARDYDDVILIDDLRIYEQGPFEHGNLPASHMPGKGLQELLDSSGRKVEKFYSHEGYLKITRN